MKIKICGLTRAIDVSRAAALGADAVGFVVTPGLSRSVVPAAVPDLIAPGPEPVLVFRSPTADEIGRAITLSGVSTVQLHLADPDVIVSARDLARVVVAVDEIIPGTKGEPILIDSNGGGTGRPFNWSRLAPRAPPYAWIAGGINPLNIWQLMRYMPWGIDVSSGVETSPGVKDEAAMAALFRVRDT